MDKWTGQNFRFLRRNLRSSFTSAAWDRSTEVETAGNSIRLLQRMGVDFTLIDEVCCEAVKGDIGSQP